MEKENLFLLLLLKSMAKTGQLNDITIMIYHGGYAVAVLKNLAIILMKIT